MKKDKLYLEDVVEEIIRNINHASVLLSPEVMPLWDQYVSSSHKKQLLAVLSILIPKVKSLYKGEKKFLLMEKGTERDDGL